MPWATFPPTGICSPTLCRWGAMAQVPGKILGEGFEQPGKPRGGGAAPPGRWERGDAVPPLDSQTLPTLVVSKAPRPHHWALALVLWSPHLPLGWSPCQLCCSCSDKPTAARGHVNIFTRFRSVCCYWPALGQARAALRQLRTTWGDRVLLYPDH